LASENWNLIPALALLRLSDIIASDTRSNRYEDKMNPCHVFVCVKICWPLYLHKYYLRFWYISCSSLINCPIFLHFPSFSTFHHATCCQMLVWGLWSLYKDFQVVLFAFSSICLIVYGWPFVHLLHDLLQVLSTHIASFLFYIYLYINFIYYI